MDKINSENKDLWLIGAYREARASYVRSISSYADEWRGSPNLDVVTPKERQLLVGPYVEAVAQLFLETKSIIKKNRFDVRKIFDSHNEKMLNTIKKYNKKGKYRISEYGINIPRIENAMFKQNQIEKLIYDIEAHGDLILDQRSLSKLLVESMSSETCRNVIILLSSVGMLDRKEFPSVVIIRPNGNLESIYMDFLEDIRSRMCEE